MKSKFRITLTIYASAWIIAIIFLCAGLFIEKQGYIVPDTVFVVFIAIPTMIIKIGTPIIIIWAIIKGIKAICQYLKDVHTIAESHRKEP